MRWSAFFGLVLALTRCTALTSDHKFLDKDVKTSNKLYKNGTTMVECAITSLEMAAYDVLNSVVYSRSGEQCNVDSGLALTAAAHADGLSRPSKACISQLRMYRTSTYMECCPTTIDECTAHLYEYVTGETNFDDIRTLVIYSGKELQNPEDVYKLMGPHLNWAQLLPRSANSYTYYYSSGVKIQNHYIVIYVSRQQGNMGCGAELITTSSSTAIPQRILSVHDMNKESVILSHFMSGYIHNISNYVPELTMPLQTTARLHVHGKSPGLPCPSGTDLDEHYWRNGTYNQVDYSQCCGEDNKECNNMRPDEIFGTGPTISNPFLVLDSDASPNNFRIKALDHLTQISDSTKYIGVHYSGGWGSSYAAETVNEHTEVIDNRYHVEHTPLYPFHCGRPNYGTRLDFDLINHVNAMRAHFQLDALKISSNLMNAAKIRAHDLLLGEFLPPSCGKYLSSWGTGDHFSPSLMNKTWNYCCEDGHESGYCARQQLKSFYGEGYDDCTDFTIDNGHPFMSFDFWDGIEYIGAVQQAMWYAASVDYQDKQNHDLFKRVLGSEQMYLGIASNDRFITGFVCKSTADIVECPTDVYHTCPAVSYTEMAALDVLQGLGPRVNRPPIKPDSFLTRAANAHAEGLMQESQCGGAYRMYRTTIEGVECCPTDPSECTVPMIRYYIGVPMGNLPNSPWYNAARAVVIYSDEKVTTPEQVYKLMGENLNWFNILPRHTQYHHYLSAGVSIRGNYIVIYEASIPGNNCLTEEMTTTSSTSRPNEIHSIYQMNKDSVIYSRFMSQYIYFTQGHIPQLTSQLATTARLHIYSKDGLDVDDWPCYVFPTDEFRWNTLSYKGVTYKRCCLLTGNWACNNNRPNNLFQTGTTRSMAFNLTEAEYTPVEKRRTIVSKMGHTIKNQYPSSAFYLGLEYNFNWFSGYVGSNITGDPIADFEFYVDPPPLDEFVCEQTLPLELELLTIVNEIRENFQVDPLKVSSKLMDAAKIRGHDLMYGEFLNETCGSYLSSWGPGNHFSPLLLNQTWEPCCEDDKPSGYCAQTQLKQFYGEGFEDCLDFAIDNGHPFWNESSTHLMIKNIRQAMWNAVSLELQDEQDPQLIKRILGSDEGYFGISANKRFITGFVCKDTANFEECLIQSPNPVRWSATV